MNKNNLQMIKRIFTNSNLQNRNNFKKLSLYNNYHNKEIEKKYNILLVNNKINEIIIKKMDYNLNKLLVIEKERKLEKEIKNYITNEISQVCLVSSIITVGLLLYYY